jgi:hypothetical protein
MAAVPVERQRRGATDSERPPADFRAAAADLPRAPLDLLHPLQVPGAGIPGCRILQEIRGQDGFVLWRLYRAVLAWSARPEGSDLGAEAWAEMRQIERGLLSRLRDLLGSAGGLLAGYMLEGGAASPQDVAWACVCLSEYASDCAAQETALDFAQAAALACPRHSRYAWLVGCMFRAAARPGEAGRWFQRAYRVALWTRDVEAQVQSLRGLVSVTGSRSVERTLTARALRLARRHGLTALEAEIRAESRLDEVRSGSRSGSRRCVPTPGTPTLRLVRE